MHGKSNTSGFKSRLGHSIRESDLEHNVKVTEFVGLLVERKTLVENSLDVIRLDDLSGLILDAELGAIEVNKHEVDTSESLQKSNFLLHQEISTFTLVLLVRLFLHDDNHIASFATGELICLTVESVLLIVGRALVNLSLKDFLLLLNFFTIASFALVGLVNFLASTTAIITRTS